MSALNLSNALTPANASIGNALANTITGTDATQTKSAQTKLKQADFIQLLVAQMKNQDPSKPMDPSQFMSQLAQFSTVSGVNDLNTSFGSLAGKLSSGQALQAAGLVGHDVLIGGGNGLLETGGSINGQITLPQSAANITLKVVNAQGVEVRSLPLGSAAAGNLAFKWDGFADDGSVAAAGNYHLKAEALIGDQQQALDVAVNSRVDSITLGQDQTSSQLNLAGGETVPLNQVLAIK